MKIRLSVPFLEREKAKQLGARQELYENILTIDTLHFADLRPFIKWIPKKDMELLKSQERLPTTKIEYDEYDQIIEDRRSLLPSERLLFSDLGIHLDRSIQVDCYQTLMMIIRGIEDDDHQRINQYENLAIEYTETQNIVEQLRRLPHYDRYRQQISFSGIYQF